MSDTRSAGFVYYPEAFGTGMYELGSKIANDDRFYRTYVGFLLKTLIDPAQLVHGRGELVVEVQKLAPHEPVVPATWCAISLATDRYFTEKSNDYAWTDTEAETAKTQWLALLAQAFVPTNKSRRIDISVLRGWREDLVKLQKRDVGPLAACDMCTSKCLYSYDVGVIDDGWWFRFDRARQHENAPRAVAQLAVSISKTLAGQPDVDLAFCIAANSVKHQDTVEDTQLNFMTSVRSSILATIAELQNANQPVPPAAAAQSSSEGISVSYSSPSAAAPAEGGLKRAQVLEVIVRVALGGSAWRQICAETMLANEITAEEVENEVKRRRKLDEER